MNQQRRLRPLLVLLLVAAVAVLGLAWAMEAAGAARAPSPAAGASADGGKVIYKVGWTRQPDNLNPFIGFESPAFEMWYLTYDSLVGYDPKTLSPMKGEESTGLATDWTVSDDGLTWTFTIRKNAKWDDGVPLTAKDVAFTYNYIVNNPDQTSNLTAYTNLIEKATAVDDYTVQFVCSKPKPDMIRHWVPILPEHIWSKIPPKDAGKKYQNTPPYVGSGPFKCVEWKKNNYVQPRRQPQLVGPQAQDRRDLLHVLHQRRHHAAGHQGRQHRRRLQPDPDAGQAARERARHHRPHHRHRRLRRAGLQLLQGAEQGPPGAEGRRSSGRRSNYAVDLQKVVDLVFMGSTAPGTTIIPPNYYKDPDWHWEPPADVKYTYDPEKAKAALDEAGYTDSDGDGVREYKGEPIELRLIARSESTEEQQMAKLIAGWFKDVGIKVKLVGDGLVDADRHHPRYEGDVLTPDYDMFIWGWYLDFDPGSMLSYFTESQIGNWSDSLLDRRGVRAALQAAGRGARPGQAQGVHRPDAADPLRAVALHRHRLPAGLRGLQHRQVGGLHRHPGPERQLARPAVRQRRVRQLPDHRAEDGRRRPRKRRREHVDHRRRRGRDRRDRRRADPACAAARRRRRSAQSGERARASADEGRPGAGAPGRPSRRSDPGAARCRRCPGPRRRRPRRPRPGARRAAAGRRRTPRPRRPRRSARRSTTFGRGAVRLGPGVHEQHLVDGRRRQRRPRRLGRGELGEQCPRGLLAERLAAHLALDDDGAGADAPERDPAAPPRAGRPGEVVALRGAQAAARRAARAPASRAGSAGAPPARRRAP